MNNGTKSANIMTWASFKKKFQPKIFYMKDGLGGKLIIKPTMIEAGFKYKSIDDIDEYYNYKSIKPLDIVKDNIDVFNHSYIIYHVWEHRDKWGKGIDVFYK